MFTQQQCLLQWLVFQFLISIIIICLQLKVPFSNSHHNQIFSILLQAAQRGIPVAEFNMEETPVTHSFEYYFSGPCGSTLPEALQL